MCVGGGEVVLVDSDETYSALLSDCEELESGDRLANHDD